MAMGVSTQKETTQVVEVAPSGAITRQEREIIGFVEAIKQEFRPELEDSVFVAKIVFYQPRGNYEQRKEFRSKIQQFLRLGKVKLIYEE